MLLCHVYSRFIVAFQITFKFERFYEGERMFAISVRNEVRSCEHKNTVKPGIEISPLENGVLNDQYIAL